MIKKKKEKKKKELEVKGMKAELKRFAKKRVQIPKAKVRTVKFKLKK